MTDWKISIKMLLSQYRMIRNDFISAINNKLKILVSTISILIALFSIITTASNNLLISTIQLVEPIIIFIIYLVYLNYSIKASIAFESMKKIQDRINSILRRTFPSTKVEDIYFHDFFIRRLNENEIILRVIWGLIIAITFLFVYRGISYVKGLNQLLVFALSIVYIAIVIIAYAIYVHSLRVLKRISSDWL